MIAVYDKVYPTVREMQFGVVPGRNPVIAETDYGPVIGFRDPGGAGMVTFFSRDPKLPIGQVIREFGIETWDQYYERSLTDRIRHLNPEK